METIKDYGFFKKVLVDEDAYTFSHTTFLIKDNYWEDKNGYMFVSYEKIKKDFSNKDIIRILKEFTRDSKLNKVSLVIKYNKFNIVISNEYFRNCYFRIDDELLNELILSDININLTQIKDFIEKYRQIATMYNSISDESKLKISLEN